MSLIVGVPVVAGAQPSTKGDVGLRPRLSRHRLFLIGTRDIPGSKRLRLLRGSLMRYVRAFFKAAHPILRMFVAGVLVTSCRDSGQPTRDALHGSFDEFVRLSSSTTLWEAPDDPIGDIGLLVECRNGDFLVGDPIKLQARRYRADGGLSAVVGRYGAGPHEFRRIGGLVERPDGTILVVDPRLGRITVLDRDLRPDTSFMVNAVPRGEAFIMDEAVLLSSASGPRTAAFTLMDDGWKPLWTVSAPSPGTMEAYPYWDSFAATPATTTATLLLTAYSLRYPIYIHRRDGKRADSLWPAPSSFRPAPVLAKGTLTGPGALERQDAWFASFDVISRLVIVEDTLLVVVHGVLRRTATSRAVNEHQRFDVYHVPSRSKLLEDIPLPPDARVLSGGRGLYLLLSQPPSRWMVGRFRFVVPSYRSLKSPRQP